MRSDVWAALLRLCAIHEVELTWVKGHAGDPDTERCDRLVAAAAQGPVLCDGLDALTSVYGASRPDIAMPATGRTEGPDPFIEDVQHNLRALCAVHGVDSTAYARQVALYRAVADTRGRCRAVERLLWRDHATEG